jgi:hypothetical protein
MLEDTKAPVLLTQSSLKEQFKTYSGKMVNFFLDPETNELFIEDPDLVIKKTSLTSSLKESTSANSSNDRSHEIESLGMHSFKDTVDKPALEKWRSLNLWVSKVCLLMSLTSLLPKTFVPVTYRVIPLHECA